MEIPLDPSNAMTFLQWWDYPGHFPIHHSKVLVYTWEGTYSICEHEFGNFQDQQGEYQYNIRYWKYFNEIPGMI